MAKTFYITTAIPYVNAQPHIGHALEFVQADTIARFQRLIGNDVYYAAGSDENSLKNVRAAENEGISTQELVDKYAKAFDNLNGYLNLSYNIYNRTSTSAHAAAAQKLWRNCKKEDIYKKSYTGLYCVGCEEFYTPDELIDGKCPEHNVPPEEVSEENYFFKLSNYQKSLEELIASDTLKIIPETRKNEVLSFIRSGLRDFSISRSVERAKNWGVPVPGDSSQIMYVWFDALTTYLTSLGYGSSDETLFQQYWEKGDVRVHAIGKGIVRFHAVYWIAMLLSAGIAIPTEEFVHGYVTVDGQKISKSLGNTIDPVKIAEQYGTDALRYYLLREIPAYGDGDFSERRLTELYTADLANGLGNLVGRIAKLAEKVNYSMPAKEYSISDSVAHHLEQYRFDLALQNIWERSRKLDQSINEHEPWKLEEIKLLAFINQIAGEIAHLAFDLQPFLPSTAEKILTQYSGNIKASSPLFPRLP